MKGKKDEQHVQLTLKSKYKVRSLASREAVLETTGTFRGIVSIGTIDALAMEIDSGELKGKIRVIPTHMVVAIDIVEAAKKEEDDVEGADMHYT
ncbi:MAG: hypothetical protein WDA16_15135 [Candidatus Thermoplasmatota archaeon]